MDLIPNPVEYVVYDGSLPKLKPGKSYAYVMDGNGLKKVAECRHFRAVVPVAPAFVPGLRVLAPGCWMNYTLPEMQLLTILDDARRESWEEPKEAMYHIRVRGGMTRITKPRQAGSGGSLAYQTGSPADVVMDLHSHHEMGAFFSDTDTRDEQGLRLYAVIGRIFTRPQIRVRVGVYGDYLDIPVTEVFAGPGPFHDLYWMHQEAPCLN